MRRSWWLLAGLSGRAPVVDDGTTRGAEAVVDKDLASAALVIGLETDCLLLLTDVAAVMTDFGLPDAEPLQLLDVEELADRSCSEG